MAKLSVLPAEFVRWYNLGAASREDSCEDKRLGGTTYDIIRAKRVSNCYIPKKKFARVRVCACARVFE